MLSWTEKLMQTKKPIKKQIEKAFAGMPAGCLMYISTPQEINEYVNQLPPGVIKPVQEIRSELAQAHGADHTCPVTTGIFLRIVAEAALEALAQQQNLNQITPFWRAIEVESALAKKLSCGPEFLIDLQAREHKKG